MYMSRRIHIVEDDEDIRYIVSYILNDMGYEISISETLADFRRQIAVEIPQLILLDVMLPDGNGLDLCPELKSQESTNHIPVIVMSAHATPDEVILKGCAADFIRKPFDLDELSDRIKKYLPL